MENFRLVEESLFGDWNAMPETAGEKYLANEVFSLWEEAKYRSDWCMEHLELAGDILLEVEDHLLLRDCLNAYVFGLFASTIITADAFIERLTTDFLESNSLGAEAKGSFGRKLAALEKYELLDANVLTWLSKLHRIRNNFAHEKGPDDEMRLFRRALATREAWELLVQRDAREAICLAYGIAARIRRRFPRLALPSQA